mgnify:CR=1 FL=1
MALKVGDKAPSFRLFSKNMTGEPKEVSLDEFKGKNLVILFFPLAYTGTCTEEMCTVTQGFNEYTNLNANVVGISVDSIFTQEAWANSNGIKVPLLSDFNKEVSKAYGAYYEEFVLGMHGVAKRSAFVVDKDGIIRYAEVLEDAGQLPNFEKIKETLKSL